MKKPYEKPSISPPIEPDSYCRECGAPVLEHGGKRLHTHEATCPIQFEQLRAKRPVV